MKNSYGVYREIILEHWRHPHNFVQIEKAGKKTFVHNGPKARYIASRYNPSCGDEIRLEILFKEDQVKEVKFPGVGCAISQASASLLTDYLKGKKIKDLEKIDKDTILKLLGVEIGPTRLKCALLSLEALKKLIQLQDAQKD